MKRKYINFIVLFFYMGSIVNADPSMSDTKLKSQAVDHYSFISFVYQISDTFEYFIKHVPLSLQSRQAAFAMVAQEKMHKAKMPQMIFKQTDADLTYNFSQESVELKYDKIKNKFFVNGKSLNISDKADFQKIYRAVEKVLDKSQAGLFHTLFVEEAEAMTTAAFLAICVAVIMGSQWAISRYVEYSSKARAEAYSKEHEPESSAGFYAMLNMPTEFECTSDGRLAKQTGDLQSGGAPFLIMDDYKKKLKEIQADRKLSPEAVKAKTDKLNQEIQARVDNRPKQQEFILTYYPSGELETVKIARPQCEFKFYSPNVPSLITETEECKKIPLNFSDSGRPIDKNSFLFTLGLDSEDANNCCKTACKNILKAKIPVIVEMNKKWPVSSAGGQGAVVTE